MRRTTTALVLLLCVGAAGATEPTGAEVASHGNAAGAPPCAACHGADGGGQAAAGIPRLAGLDVQYIDRQLASFADGTRVNPVMVPVAKALTPDERAAVARYYARLPIPAAAAHGSTIAPTAGIGVELALRGKWSVQVPACVQCHGPHGVGVGTDFPPLAGQPAQYLAAQLRDFQAGERRNDQLGLMRHVAAELGEGDIRALAQWFAAQPAATPKEQP